MQNPLFVRLSRNNWQGLNVLVAIKNAPSDGIPENDIRRICFLTKSEFDGIIELLTDNNFVKTNAQGFYLITQEGINYIDGLRTGKM